MHSRQQSSWDRFPLLILLPFCNAALVDRASSPASDAVQTASKPTSTIVIVSCILSGLALLIMLVVSYLIWRQRQLKKPRYVSARASVLDDGDPGPAHENRVAASHVPWQSTAHSSSERLGHMHSTPLPGTVSHTHTPTMSSSDNMASSPVFTPVRRERAPSPYRGGGNQEKLRVMRQMEINERLQSAQREMNDLRSRQAPSESQGSGSSASGQEMASLREQVQELRDRIEGLQGQHQSDWALGLSDEQPPAYM